MMLYQVFDSQSYTLWATFRMREDAEWYANLKNDPFRAEQEGDVYIVEAWDIETRERVPL